MQLEELVKLIEDSADELAGLMVRNVRESPRMAAYHRFGDEELAIRIKSNLFQEGLISGVCRVVFSLCPDSLLSGYHTVLAQLSNSLVIRRGLL